MAALKNGTGACEDFLLKVICDTSFQLADLEAQWFGGAAKVKLAIFSLGTSSSD